MNTLATQLKEKCSGLIAKTKAIWKIKRDLCEHYFYFQHTTYVTGHPDGLKVNIRIIPHIGILKLKHGKQVEQCKRSYTVKAYFLFDSDKKETCLDVENGILGEKSFQREWSCKSKIALLNVLKNKLLNQKWLLFINEKYEVPHRRRTRPNRRRRRPNPKKVE
jgi:hypothetical protein